jgi:lauroyl/myristoyl acyltransferase
MNARGDADDVKQPPQPAWVRACLALFFFLGEHAAWVLRWIRPLVPPITLWLSRAVAKNLRLNAACIFGRSLPAAEQRAFARGVIRNFYDFVVELAASGCASTAEILNRIEGVDGESAYLAARRHKRGVILVTAHVGAFEVGLAALRRVEPRVHVVFKRDDFAGFERIRTQVRKQLDVREAAIDGGLPALMALRDALLADEAVVMQGDRAMPGQRAAIVPFLHGRLRMPIGPVKLARLTGSPLVPVIVLRRGFGRFRIHLGEPVYVMESDNSASDETDPALLSLARTFESFVREHPQQWLVLDRAFVDEPSEENRRAIHERCE